MANDVMIIGGGPAGSAMGCYLSLAGIPNQILESAHHPRPHVGESLIPSTTRVLDELGFLPTMEREGFVHKTGAAWHSPARSSTLSTKFRDFPPLAGVHQEHTYHVDRARFDHLLFEHAAHLGSRVRQGVRVREVLFEGGRARGVRIQEGDETVDLPGRMVVDASGRAAVLGTQLGWKRSDPLFDQFAVHGWFEGVDRGAQETALDVHIHFLPVRRGWVWQIPIDDRVTSIGVVADRRVFRKASGDHAAWFEEMVGAAADIERAMRDARPASDLEVEADYSYTMERFAGDGFLLVGDAARFVDPIFSSGVSIALESARFASGCVERAFDRDEFGPSAFEPYDLWLRKGTALWYEFICLYYKILPIFTRFISSTKHRREFQSLLQGDVFGRDEAPVLDAMRRFAASAEETEGHLFASHVDPEIPLHPGRE